MEKTGPGAGQEDADILSCARKVMPFIKGLLGEEVNVGLTDLNSYLYYVDGRAKFNLRTGDRVKEGSIAHQTMRNAGRTVARVEREIYGVPYIATGYPLRNPADDRIIGAIMMGVSVELQENLRGMAARMREQVASIASAVADLSAAAQELAATAETLNGNVRGIAERLKKSDDILSLIRGVAEQTHMLGLNAAIEAARVGDAGRGFNVVAGEIRRLSGDTRRSVEEIMHMLRAMKASIAELTCAIRQTAAAAQEQAASMEEINVSVGGINGVVAELETQAERLVE